MYITTRYTLKTAAARKQRDTARQADILHPLQWTKISTNKGGNKERESTPRTKYHHQYRMAQRTERYSPGNTRILALPRRVDHREQHDHQEKSNTSSYTSTARDIKGPTHPTSRNSKDYLTRQNLRVLAQNWPTEPPRPVTCVYPYVYLRTHCKSSYGNISPPPISLMRQLSNEGGC